MFFHPDKNESFGDEGGYLGELDQHFQGERAMDHVESLREFLGQGVEGEHRQIDLEFCVRETRFLGFTEYPVYLVLLLPGFLLFYLVVIGLVLLRSCL